MSKLEELKEKDPLEYHTRCFDTQKNSIMNLINSLNKGQSNRVLQALMVFPLNDFKEVKGKTVPKLGLVTQQEKIVFDFCLKMLDHKANVIRLGTDEIIKMGVENVTEPNVD